MPNLKDFAEAVKAEIEISGADAPVLWQYLLQEHAEANATERLRFSGEFGVVTVSSEEWEEFTISVNDKWAQWVSEMTGTMLLQWIADNVSRGADERA